ncbi:hypothetical protein [Sorangium sp. So ce1182]|uniref:hypothetical protein n=1 Tax=Sorangium sp. So ce1182 TaxID=3133334 RepID=UPI003F63EBDD
MGNYINNEWLESRRYAERSYQQCPSPAAAFYLGASLYHDANEHESELPFNPDFAKARCLLEEAIDKYGQRPIEPALVEEAQAMIAETIRRGATHLEIHGASGAVRVRKGNGQIDESRSIEQGGSVDLCVMPGHYQIEVDGVAGKGEALRTIRRGQPTEVVEFERVNLGGAKQDLLALTVGAGVLASSSGFILWSMDLLELAACESANRYGKKCVNQGELNQLVDLDLGVTLVGLGVSVAAATYLIVLKTPPPHQVPKDPRAPRSAVVQGECLPSFGYLLCRVEF